MPSLHAELSHKGAELLRNVVNSYEKHSQNAEKQNSSLATYGNYINIWLQNVSFNTFPIAAPKITAAITDIQWQQLTAKQIFNRFRALYGFKHLNVRFEGRSIHLMELRLPAEINSSVLPPNCPPGGFIYQRQQQSLLVRCAEQTDLEILMLKIEGKKPMSALQFNNGYLKKLKNTEMLVFANKLMAES